MADIQSNININVDTTNAMAAIRNLQSQISAFHQQMQKSGSAANAAASANMQRNLINSINATKKFSASVATVSTETESFTNALEKNKLSMGQYFRYAGASSKTFGKVFTQEFNTISKVAESRVRTLQTQYIKMGRDANGAMKAIKVRPLSLDMQNLSTQTMIASQKQQIFNQLLRQGSTNLLNFGKNTQWAGRQLMVGFTVPLSIMGMTAIKEFQKIEEQVIKLKRVYGDVFTTNAETQRAVEEVRQLADEFTKYGLAVESTIGLAASVAQMGNVGADMINQVTEASKLAILGGMEQEKALDTTISLTNAFGIATEDLTEKINFLNAAENQTILAIDDFTEAVPKAGSVVAQLGGSVEDLAFFLTAMREGGVNASQAANALKSSLARLINPTQQARDDLNKLGIDVMGIVEGNVGDLKGTIMDLGVALDELQPLERSRALEELFGKFQFARMSTLFQNISKEGSQAQEILKLTRASAAELQILADRELSRVEESPATKLEKQIEKLQAALAPIGEEFVKLVTPIVEFFTKLLKKFNEMDEGAKSFVTGLVTVLGLIAPAAIMSFGLIANGIANLMKVFNSYRSFLQMLSGSNRDITTTTQYMTQEQLEAASVATNLGQSHQFLSQQFTVEASALQELTNVYRAANAELMRFNATTSSVPARPVRVAPPVTRAPTGRRAGSPAGPVGYNKGTLNVPGPRGAGDIVPAVLSPGEAVIPARQSQKYSGFLEAIMNDQVPGMFFGGIAGMLGRSRVATRMNSGTFMSSLRSGDMSYKSGFATGTGADFTDRLGRPMKQHQLMRRQAENKLYGTPVGSNDPSMRPTYGSVAMSPLQRILSLLFGGRKGRQFASVTNPMASSLDQYGDISLIGKKGMSTRASTFVGDTLLKYSKNPAWVRGTAPMRGASAEQMKTAGFGAFDTPFGQNKLPGGGTSVNPQVPYIEAQTMGGFRYSEIDKIVTNNPAVKKQLRAELKAAGLGGIKVGGPGFLSSLMTRLGVPGFENGIFNVPGPKGAGDIVPAMLAPGEAVVPAAQTQKYAGLIKGIISDNIPGFEQGRVKSKGKTVAMPSGSSISANTEVGAKKLQREIEKLIQGFIGLGRSVEQAEQEVLQLAAAAEKGGSVRADDLAQQARADAPGASMAANNTMATRTSMGRSPAVKGNEGAASLHVTDPTPMSEQDKSELVSQLESQGFGDSAAATKLKAGGKVSAATDATVIAPAIMNKSGKVSGSQASEIVANTPGMATADLAAATNLDSNDPVFQQAEQNMQNYLGAMGDEILTDKQIAEALRASILDAADSVGGSSGKKVRSQMSQNKVLVGGRGTTEDRRARVALPTGFKGKTSSGISAEGPQPGQKTYLDRGTVKKFHAEAERETIRLAKDLDQETQKKKPRRSKSGAKTIVAKDAQSDAQVYSKEFDAKSQDPYMLARDNRNSPHPQSGKDGASDGRKYRNRMDAEVAAGRAQPTPDRRYPVDENGFEIIPAPDFLLDDDQIEARNRQRQTTQSGAPVPPGQSGPPTPPGQMPTPPGQQPRRRSGAPAGAPPPLPTSAGGVPQPGGYTSPIVDPLGTPEGKTEAKKSAKGFVRNFGGKFKNAGASIGKQALGFIEKSSIGQSVVSGMARAGGNTLVGSDGNVIYDASTDTQYDSQGNVVATGNNIAAGTAAATSRGEAGDISQDIVVGPDGNPVVDKRGNPVSQKQADRQARKMASRQKRGMVAGRLAGAMGSASMMLGMASMMPGVGENPIMQQIQGFMPALFGLSAILPMLAALPGPIGLVVAALGALGFGLYKWNETIQKSREEGRELGNALAMSTDKLVEMSKVTGTVSATEIRRKEQEEQLTGTTEGQRKFGMNFMDSEAGSSLMEQINTIASSGLGMDAAAESMGRQLSLAIMQGVLSPEQANSVVAAIGAEMNDYQFSAEIQGTMISLIGPNGKDIAKEPLEVALAIQEAGSEQITDFQSMIGERFNSDFSLFNNIMLDPSAAAEFEEMDPQVQADVRKRASLEEQYGKGGIGGFFAGIGGAFGDMLGGSEAWNEAKTFVEETGGIMANATKLQSAGIQLGINQIAENQQILDAMKAQYDQQIESLEADIKAEQNAEKRKQLEQDLIDLKKEQANAIKTLNTQNASTLDQIVEMRDMYKDTDAFDQAIEKSVLGRFEEDDPMKVFAEETLKTLSLLEDSDFKSNLQLGIASGELSVSNVQTLLNAFEKDPKVQARFDLITDEQGFGQASQLLTLLGNAGLEGDQLSYGLNLFANIESPEDFENKLQALAEISQIKSEYGIDIDITGNNLEAKLNAVTGAMDKLEDQPDMVKKTDLEIIGGPEFEAILANWQELVGDTDTITKTAIFEFISTYTTENPLGDRDLLDRYAQEMGYSVMGQSSEGYNLYYKLDEVMGKDEAMAAATAYFQGKDNKTSYGEGDGKEGDEETENGGPAGSMLDSLTSKLKLVRDETVKFTKGWSDSMAQLMNLFGDDRRITIFDGLQQQLRSLGAGENLIELIAGMDPDEFEKRKNELFTIKNGQIVALKDAAISIGDALNSIKIGEFQNDQEKTLAQMENQETAFQILREAGLGVADAYAVIANEALAAAIATGELTDKEIARLKSQIESVRQESKIADTLEEARKAIENFDNELKLKADVDTYVNSAQFNAISNDLAESPVTGTVAAAAIFKDETLSALVAAGKAGSAEFATRLKQVLSDSSFMQALFDEGYQNVQTAFQVQEQRLRADFEAMMKAGTLFSEGSFNEAFGLSELAELTGMTQDGIKEIFSAIEDPQAVVEQAEQRIATLNFQIDDLNAELEEISNIEEDINEKYDSRLEALEKTENLNNSIARAQKSQLDIADALSRGDIAAAARVVQEARKAEAEERAQKQRDAIEAAREAELEAVRSENGQTRKQIEEEIRRIEQEIFEIEESRLEVAQRVLELSNILLEKQIEYDEVLDRTRDQWESIRLKINEAKIASDEFIASMQAALEAKPVVESSYSGGGYTPSPTPDPTPDPEPTPDPTPDPEPAPEPDKPSYTSYRVKPGDTLSGIASRNNTTLKEILDTNPVFTNNPKYQGGNMIWSGTKVMIPNKASGGLISNYAMGGMVDYKAGGGVMPAQASSAGNIGYYPMGGLIPYKRMGGMIPYKANGGLFQSVNTDTVPAMLTPGEFVVRRYAVDKYGVDKLKSINNGTYSGESVYNYNLNVNVKSDANPDDIARVVMTKIKQVDSQRMRSNRF